MPFQPGAMLLLAFRGGNLALRPIEIGHHPGDLCLDQPAQGNVCNHAVHGGIALGCQGGIAAHGRNGLAEIGQIGIDDAGMAGGDHAMQGAGMLNAVNQPAALLQLIAYGVDIEVPVARGIGKDAHGGLVPEPSGR